MADIAFESLLFRFRSHRGRDLGSFDPAVGLSRSISGISNPGRVGPELEIEPETI